MTKYELFIAKKNIYLIRQQNRNNFITFSLMKYDQNMGRKSKKYDKQFQYNLVTI